MVSTILLVFAFVFCIIEAFRGSWPAWALPHLGWLGVAFWILSLLLGGRLL